MGRNGKYHPEWGNPITKENRWYAHTEKWILVQKLGIPKTQNTPQKQKQPLPQSKRLKKVFQANGPMKQAGLAFLISNKMDFQPKVIKREEKDTSYSSKGKYTRMMFQFWRSMLKGQGYPYS